MKKLVSYGGLAVLFVLFLAFNVFSGTALTTARADLTENKLYTLSEGTKNILASMPEKVTLRFFFTKGVADEEAPGVVSYAQRVRELLQEYAAKAKGKIALEVSDPEPFSELEDRAVQYGLKGLQVPGGDGKLFFGLAGTNATDQEEVIEFFDPSREASLEYDITKVVYNLSHPKKKVLGVLTSLPMDGNPMARMMDPRARAEEPWIVLEQLRQTFDVKMQPTTTDKIDADLDVLMIVHPQNLSPQTLYAIDQYVLGGGKVVAFLDPHCDSQQVQSDPQNPMKQMMADRSSSLGALLDAWGIEMDKDNVAADKELALRLQGQDVVQYLGLRTDKGSMNKDDFITAQLDKMNLLDAGVLRKKDGGTTTVTPLLETTKSSMKVAKTKIQFQTPPKELLESFQSGNERLMLAARVTGIVKTAFPEGAPKPAAEKPDAPTPVAPAESLKESKVPINVIVVADADMVADGAWAQAQAVAGTRFIIPFADNGPFVINAVDNLSGSNDLISLRSRGRSIRPIDRVADIRREAESRSRQKEKDLEAKLRDAETKINELQGNKDAKSAMILSPEQQAEIEKFREERVKARKDLRAVKYDLKRDIDGLKIELMWANAAAVPLCVLLSGIGVWWIRRKRMQAARTKSVGN